MSHKNLLKSILVLVGLVCSVSLFSCKNAGSKNAGIQLWSVRDDMKKDAAGTLEKLGKMGYSYIEAAGYSDGKFYGMEPQAFKELVEKNGLKFTGSHAGLPAPTATSWDSAMLWWNKCLAAHKAAGVSYIVQPFMTKEAYENLDALANYCKYFNAVGEKCNKAGIRFGYHNHDKEFKSIHDTVIYDFMLKNLKPELVTMQLDLYWMKVGGKEPVEYFKNFPGRFEMWHVKDETELGGKDAIMDFKPIFGNAERAGMKYYIVEVERYHFPPLESVQKSLEFIQKAEFIK